MSGWAAVAATLLALDLLLAFGLAPTPRERLAWIAAAGGQLGWFAAEMARTGA